MTLFINQIKERNTSMQKLLVILSVLFAFIMVGSAYPSQDQTKQDTKKVQPQVIKNVNPVPSAKSTVNATDTNSTLNQKAVEHKLPAIKKHHGQMKTMMSKNPQSDVKKEIKTAIKDSVHHKDAEKKQGKKK